jgi:hypothetical protein
MLIPQATSNIFNPRVEKKQVDIPELMTTLRTIAIIKSTRAKGTQIFFPN